jgi:hypothetical protein
MKAGHILIGCGGYLVGSAVHRRNLDALVST